MKASSWAVFLSVVLIALATLLPASYGGSGGRTLCLVCGDRGLADFILNVCLFVPLGAALGWRGHRFAVALLAGLLFSGTIEVLQVTAVGGRDAHVGDLVSNTTGAAVGWLLLRGWLGGLRAGRNRRAREGGARAASSFLREAAAIAAVLLLLIGGLSLYRRALPDSIYYTQWTARFGNMQPYEGRVLSSRIGPVELGGPPWRMTSATSDSVRALIAAGAPIEVTVEAGPMPIGVAPMFSIYDDHQAEVLMLAADGDGLLYRHRYLADALRLDGGDIHLDDALAGVARGDTIVIRVAGERDGAGYCTHVVAGGGEALAGACGLGATVGDTWMLLYYMEDAGVATRRALGAFWLFALAFGVPLLLAATPGVRLILPALVLLWAVPRVIGFMFTPWWQLAVVGTALWLAGALTRRLRAASLARHD